MNRLNANDYDTVRTLVGNTLTENLIATNTEQEEFIRELLSVSIILYYTRSCGSFMHSDAQFSSGHLSNHAVDGHLMFVVPFDENMVDWVNLTFDNILSSQVRLGLTPIASIKDATRVGLFISTQHKSLKSKKDMDDLLLLNIIVGDDSRGVVITVELIGFSDGEIASLQSKIASFIGRRTTYDGVMDGGCAFLKNLCRQYTDKCIKIRRVAFRLLSVRHFMEYENFQNWADYADDDDDTLIRGLMRDSNMLSYKRKVAEKLGAPSPGVTIQ